MEEITTTQPAPSAQAGVTEPVAAAPTGETAPAAGVQKEAEAGDLNGEFENLIKGKFKAQFDARMQDTIQKRLKGSREAADRLQAATPILELLGRKYGVDPADLGALTRAVAGEAAAQEAESTLQQESQRRIRAQADRLHAQWLQQEQQTRQLYPSFDMGAELQNPQFVQLISNDVDIRTAYEVLHRDEILPAAMAFAAQAVEQNLVKKIAANGIRPPENGMGSQAAAVVRSDVSQLTRSDMEEISRRVARGERVSFG